MFPEVQQGAPASLPQRPQVPLAQRVPAAVQALGMVLGGTAQHGCPGPPQVPQAPAAQVPATGAQLAPVAMQRLPTQQPPAAQVLPGQQEAPAVPQLAPSGIVVAGLSVADESNRIGPSTATAASDSLVPPVPPEPASLLIAELDEHPRARATTTVATILDIDAEYRMTLPYERVRI